MKWLHFFNTKFLLSTPDPDEASKISDLLTEKGIRHYEHHYLASEYYDYRMGGIFYLSTPFDYAGDIYSITYEIRVHHSQYEEAKKLIDAFR